MVVTVRLLAAVGACQVAGWRNRAGYDGLTNCGHCTALAAAAMRAERRPVPTDAGTGEPARRKLSASTAFECLYDIDGQRPALNSCTAPHAAAFGERRTAHSTSGRSSSQRTPVAFSISGQYSAGTLPRTRQLETAVCQTPHAAPNAFCPPAFSIALSSASMPHYTITVFSCQHVWLRKKNHKRVDTSTTPVFNLPIDNEPGDADANL